MELLKTASNLVSPVSPYLHQLAIQSQLGSKLSLLVSAVPDPPGHCVPRPDPLPGSPHLHSGHTHGHLDVPHSFAFRPGCDSVVVH
jgi:hypothetical protein